MSKHRSKILWFLNSMTNIIVNIQHEIKSLISKWNTILKSEFFFHTFEGRKRPFLTYNLIQTIRSFLIVYRSPCDAVNYKHDVYFTNKLISIVKPINDKWSSKLGELAYSSLFKKNRQKMCVIKATSRKRLVSYIIFGSCLRFSLIFYVCVLR